jgi:uncharacterized protein YaiL (DUF2058 family)
VGSLSTLGAEIVTSESAGAAGMVGVVLALIAVIRMLIARNSTKNGNTPASKSDVEQLFKAYKNPTEIEKQQRDLTRDRLAAVHRMAKDTAEHHKEHLQIARESLWLQKEIATTQKELKQQIQQLCAEIKALRRPTRS